MGVQQSGDAEVVVLFPFEELLRHYRDMLLLRRFEEKVGQLYYQGMIAGFCHLYIGQEAIVVGAKAALDGCDTMITSYRDHAHALVCGAGPGKVMAELTGRITGSSKGKGGSMHIFHLAGGFYGGHGIVGAPVPLGTGLAFGHKYLEDGGICACFFGDGAVNQGQVYESFNMAALWKLPVLYVIENNRYSMGTSQARGAVGELYQRCDSYGIPSAQVDGMSVIEVRRAVDKWAQYVRSGQGPALLEMLTYRYRGHSMSDPAQYRSRDEVRQMREQQDPLLNLHNTLIGNLLVGGDTFRKMEKEVRKVVAEAVLFAEQSPLPPADELWTDVLLPTETKTQPL